MDGMATDCPVADLAVGIGSRVAIGAVADWAVSRTALDNLAGRNH